MIAITYHFKDLAELADIIEGKARQAERHAKASGPQMRPRFQFEAAAYLDVVNILRNAKVGG